VHANHEKVARPNASCFSFATRAMKRAKLTNQVVVAYLQVALLSPKLYVLRLSAQHGVFENAVAGADSGKPLDDGVGPNLAIWPNFDVIFDNGSRMN
jgi:hypothetical protein